MFYADCEGMLRTEPVAAEYQKDWARAGRMYLLETKGRRIIHRARPSPPYARTSSTSSATSSATSRAPKALESTRGIPTGMVSAYVAVSCDAIFKTHCSTPEQATLSQLRRSDINYFGIRHILQIREVTIAYILRGVLTTLSAHSDKAGS